MQENVKEGMISVIVPVYNMDRYLKKCIEGILNQTYSNLELILVNDGSTDNSEKICTEYAQRDSRVRTVTITNHGQGYARNIGIDLARGEYIGFSDADDTMDNDMYEKLYKMMVSSNADMSGCDHSSIVDGVVIYNRGNKSGVLSREEALECFSMGKGIVWGVWDKLFRADRLHNIRFPNEKVHAEDALFLLEFIKNNKCFVYNELGKYHHNNSNPKSYTKRKWSKSNLGLTTFYRELYLAMVEYDIAERIEPMAVRFYENLLSTFIRCSRNGYKAEAEIIRQEMERLFSNIWSANNMKLSLKIDIWLCIHMPLLGYKINFWYR